MTSCLLYTLAQTGFSIDILQFGVNIALDVINLAGELADSGKESDGANFVDLSSPCDMEG